jgi:hypothetical protein
MLQGRLVKVVVAALDIVAAIFIFNNVLINLGQSKLFTMTFTII